ncbi:PD-(D/E)XK nuclease family protein, partial [Nocardia sp. NPDC004722]
TTLAGTVIRGRMDAVFRRPDGTWVVVDWKTGAEPQRAEEDSVAIQLAVYRLAWARLESARTGEPEADILANTVAAFHYVRTNRTIAPEHLPGPTELAAIITTAAPRRVPPTPPQPPLPPDPDEDDPGPPEPTDVEMLRPPAPSEPGEPAATPPDDPFPDPPAWDFEPPPDPESLPPDLYD